MGRRKRSTNQVVVTPEWGAYQVALRSAKRELDNLRDRLESIDDEKKLIEQRMQKVEETIAALSPLCADEEGADSHGLKEACLRVLKGTFEFLEVPKIKDLLIAQGTQMSGYKNPLAVLHTTLNRMVGSGDAQKLKGADGKVRFGRVR